MAIGALQMGIWPDVKTLTQSPSLKLTYYCVQWDVKLAHQLTQSSPWTNFQSYAPHPCINGSWAYVFTITQQLLFTQKWQQALHTVSYATKTILLAANTSTEIRQSIHTVALSRLNTSESLVSIFSVILENWGWHKSWMWQKCTNSEVISGSKFTKFWSMMERSCRFDVFMIENNKFHSKDIGRSPKFSSKSFLPTVCGRHQGTLDHASVSSLRSVQRQLRLATQEKLQQHFIMAFALLSQRVATIMPVNIIRYSPMVWMTDFQKLLLLYLPYTFCS